MWRIPLVVLLTLATVITAPEPHSQPTVLTDISSPLEAPPCTVM
jgi:hypothetical protein